MPSKFIYWTPRILSLLLIAFLALFSLDVFDSASNYKEVIIGLLMHNIPVFILIIFLIISWKREIVGAIVYFLGGLLYIVLNLKGTQDWRMAIVWSLQISGIAFVIAGFFLANWIKRKK